MHMINLDPVLYCEKNFKEFHLKPKMRQGNPFSLFLYNMVLEVLARAVKQEEATTGIQTEKEEVTVTMFVNDVVT